MYGRVQIRIKNASPDDARLIKDELASVLADEHFVSSKRYPAFLSHVVQKTLDGQADDLKERSIGIDVFRRRPDFDTSSDTVVRFTAGEVRRRLNSIYLEKSSRTRIQIELPLGSYVPEFFHVLDTPPTESPVEVLSQNVTSPSVLDTVLPDAWPQRPSLVKVLGFAVASCIVVVACSLGFWEWNRATSVDRFWLPVRALGSPSIVAAGAFMFSASSPTGRLPAEKSDVYPYMSMATTGSIAMLAQHFGRSHIEYLLQSSVSTTLTEMRAHPTILVGAYDNDWTLRFVNDLRFRFAPRPATRIYDSRDPSISWTRPAEMPAYKDADDYAIVARFKDKLTENTVVVIAGIGQNGTIAATQFATTPRYLDLVSEAQFKGWEHKNVEIVIKTTVIDGKAGPPTIAAVDVW